jgi:twitching motility protein PilT
MAIDLDTLLISGVERGASDIHLKPNSRPVLRIHGRLGVQKQLEVVSAEDMEQTARRILPERLYAQLKEGREVDLAYGVSGHGRFRVNMFLAEGAIRAVLRAIPRRAPSFAELGLPPILEKLSMESRGMILVTGITGSGKSTTLAAIIDYINRHRNTHIVTIEDPIEFTHEDVECVISQREIGHDSMSFATALRAALRQDPDVILVGEMRDPETMTVALHAAETGHLVLSTLHTLNATETVNRIIGSFPPHREQQIRDQLAAVIQGIVSQRLVVSKDGTRRVAAVEVMIGTALIRDCIREPKRTHEITGHMAAGATQYGMQTFDQCLLKLFRDGRITRETAREAATNPDDFDLRVRGIMSTGDLTLAAPKQDPEPAAVPAAAGPAATSVTNNPLYRKF